jgi:hypothetical protein
MSAFPLLFLGGSRDLQALANDVAAFSYTGMPRKEFLAS